MTIKSTESFIRGINQYITSNSNEVLSFGDIKLYRDERDDWGYYRIEMSKKEYWICFEEKRRVDKSFIHLFDDENENHSMIQFTLDNSNFRLNGNQFVLIQNRGLTIGRRIKGMSAEFKQRMYELGFNSDNIITKESTKKTNYDKILNDIFSWCAIRLKVKLELEKKYRINEGESDEFLEEDFNKIVFNVAKDIYEERISREYGVNKLVQQYDMNRGSANMILGQVFPQLLNGEMFTRTLRVSLFDSFLRLILEEYGVERLALALSALKMHIDYMRERGDSKITLGRVYKRYLSLLGTIDSLTEIEKEQDEISSYLKRGKTRGELIAELGGFEPELGEKVAIGLKSYKRNNKAVAIIKILRDFKCQICGYSILKKDGSSYIEAAHIVPKHQGGEESARNLILLCPNHHKEFDLGDLEIIEHNEEVLKFRLNEERYTLSLGLE